MGIFDSIKNMIGSAAKREAGKAVTGAVKGAVDAAVGKGRNHTENFTFAYLPKNVAELQALPEASLDSAFKTAALTVAVLCNFENDPEGTYEMLDFLKGPESISTPEKQFIRERLQDKVYKVFSYFAGTSPENGYTPTQPYTISVIENPYSFDNENWATLYVQSSGADNPRGIKLRKKPSTGEWFLNDIQCLSDVRLPAEKDPWA